jgi:hypothetical protein
VALTQSLAVIRVQEAALAQRERSLQPERPRRFVATWPDEGQKT